MTLLILPEDDEVEPTGRDVAWTWAIWLPVAGLCFYVAWQYATLRTDDDLLSGGIELALGLVGVGSLARSATKTWRWRKRGSGGAG